MLFFFFFFSAWNISDCIFELVLMMIHVFLMSYGDFFVLNYKLYEYKKFKFVCDRSINF